MATIARFKAVVMMGNTKMTGFTAWVAWCFLHLLYIVGFKSQVGTLVSWFFSFLSGCAPPAHDHEQQLVGRLALEQLGAGASGSSSSVKRRRGARAGGLTHVAHTAPRKHSGAGSRCFRP